MINASKELTDALDMLEEYLPKPIHPIWQVRLDLIRKIVQDTCKVMPDRISERLERQYRAIDRRTAREHIT